VSATGAVFPNLEEPASYRVEYNCHNARGVAAVPMVRNVFVRDTQCPACVIAEGPATVEASFVYVDPGASCTDTLDGPINVTKIGTVQYDEVGTYFITYRARDSAGNWNDGEGQPCSGAQSYVRTVNVVDTLMPVIHLHYKDDLGVSRLVARSAANDRGAGDEENPVATYASAANLMAEAATPLQTGGAAAVLAAAAAVAALAAVALLAWSRRGVTTSGQGILYA
jgi:hypothetical protein